MAELFLHGLNLSISAGWLVLVVLLLRLVLKKAPRWIHVLLWGVVGVRLVLPFSLESAWSLIPSSQTIPTTVLSGPSFDVSTGFSVVDQPINEYLGSRYFEGVTVPTQQGLHIMTILSVVWLVGMVVLLGYGLFSYVRLRRKVATAVLLQPGIYQSEWTDTPFVLGVFRPRIYLPYHIKEEDLPYVLAHEQAHIQRRDHWWKALGFLLLCVYWFHPLLWVAYALLCRDLELACDEKVIRPLASAQRADYSQALLSCSIHPKFPFAYPLAFGEVGVKERVKHVLHYKKPGFWVLVFALVACVILSVCFLTDPKAPSPAQAEQLTIYVGDAPKVASIAQELPYPSAYSYDFISLQTSRQPYGLTVYLRQSQDGAQESLQSCAQKAFEGIHNLDVVSFLVQDSVGNPVKLARYQRENTRQLTDLSQQQLLQLVSQNLDVDGLKITDWVFALDGAYDLDAVVEYTSSTGHPWNLAFVRDGVVYPVSQAYGENYSVSAGSHLEYLGNGVVQNYLDNQTLQVRYQVSMAFQYREDTGSLHFQSSEQEVPMEN